MAHLHRYHPITDQPELINERGLMVFDDVRRMPVYQEPFTTPYMVIALNLQGWVKIGCDMKPTMFRQHSIAVITAHQMICPQESSDDYHAMLIVLSPKFQEEMKRQYLHVFRDNFFYAYQPHFQLDEAQFGIIHQLFRMLHTISHIESPSRWEMLGELLDVLFLLLRGYRGQNGADTHHPSARERLFSRFYQAITEHYRESREVRFYANLFHLTPKHFATVIKQHTGTNALEWINGYVAVQARMLLRHRLELNIQEIALLLNFSDQASFSRFFKTQTGMSPSEYRDRM